MTPDADRTGGSSSSPRKESARRLAERREAARSRGGGGEGAARATRSDAGGAAASTNAAGGSAAGGAAGSATSHHTSGSAPKRRHWFRWTLVVIVAIVLATGLFACSTVNQLSRGLPDLGNVNRVATFQTTRIYDVKHRQIASLAGEGNRLVVPDQGINALTRHAVVATEDRRFYSHPAVDFWGILRAAWTNIVRGSVVQGGSTITQQYVKNAYFSQKRTLVRKIREVLLAYRLEKKYSKDQILDKYLNTIYFGEGAYGIEAAAQTYYGKHAKDLALPEAAMMAGVIRSPARYSPFNHPAKAKERRATVLALMVSEGYITQQQADKANRAKLPKARHRLVKNGVAQYFIDQVTQKLVARVGERAAFSGGLKVYTTLDLDLQKAAEDAIHAELDLPKDPSASLVALDPRTGAVRALIGGRDYQTQQYSVATQGHRQTGSSFKPFVLATAISRGVSPDQYFNSDSPATFDVTGAPQWKVNNYEGHGNGDIPLTDATARSVNVVYARLMMAVGAANVADTARRMGIVTPVNPDPAIALGGLKIGVGTLEMASAYGTLANQGVRVPPYTIERIVDADGNVIRGPVRNTRKALDPAVAYLVTDTLKGVIDHGTGVNAQIGRPEAGKTGTTQHYADAWFIGYVPQMSTAVWVGYPQSDKVPMTNVHGIKVTGGSFPAKIWARFMNKALAAQKALDFAQPPSGSIVTAKIDPTTGYLATPYCPLTVDGRYVKGHEPTELCPVHAELIVPKVVGMQLDAALAALKAAGLEGTATAVRSTQPKNKVLIQTPAPGTKGKRGLVVRLQVSGGPNAALPPPTETSKTAQGAVPNVVGMTLAAAESALSRAGLKAAASYKPSAQPRDQVIGQDPAAGAKLPRGRTVNLTVSGGKGVSTVPNVVGLTQDAATAKLEGLGFVTASQPATPAESKGHAAGTVLRQSPGGSAQAPPGSTVIIYVAQ